MRSRIFLVMLVLGWIGVAGAEPSDLEALVREGLANNPEIHAAQARWEMYREKSVQAGAWDDPMVMVKIQNAMLKYPLSFNKDIATAKVIGISQQIPFAGKRALTREVALQEAASTRWLRDERQVALRRMIKETYYQLYYVDQAQRVVTRTIQVLEDLITLSETRYGVGQGLQQDVLKAQVERSKMAEMQIALTQQRSSLAATLDSLLYRPVASTWPMVKEVEIEPVSATPEALMQAAQAHRPQLQSLASLVEKGEAGQALAKKEFYPDFTVALEYMQREPAMDDKGDDMFSLSVSINLPLQRQKRHAMLAEAKAETRMAQAEWEMTYNTIRQNIADSLSILTRSRSLADLYRTTIVPQATDALEAAMAAYRVGKADFMNVLDSQMALYTYERQYHEAVAEHQMQLARLEGVVGVRLPLVEH